MNRNAPRAIDQYLLQLPVELLASALLFTLLMHLARGIGRVHARFAKTLLVAREGGAAAEAAPLPVAAHQPLRS